MTAIISVDPKAIYREDGKQVETPEGFFSSAFHTDKLMDCRACAQCLVAPGLTAAK